MAAGQHRLSTWGVMLILVVSFVVAFSVAGLWLYHLEIVQDNAARLRLDPTAARRRMEMPEFIVIVAFFGAVPNLAALGLSWYWLRAQSLWGWMAAEIATGAVASWLVSLSDSQSPFSDPINPWWGILVAPFVLPLLVTAGVLLARRQRLATAQGRHARE